MARKPQLSPETKLHAMGKLVVNLLAGRSLLARAGQADAYGIDPPNRDLDRECGYPDSPGVHTYRRLYRRWGVARRVVDIWPDECWSAWPLVYELESEERTTAFETGWGELLRRVPAFSYMHRLDRCAGIGRYGVMLLGLPGSPDAPAPGFREYRQAKARPEGVPLLYLQTYAEDAAAVVELDQRPDSPRRGQPLYYQFVVPAAESGAGPALTAPTDGRRVHWSRVIHFADGRESSEVYAPYRMEPVLNYLLDLRKIGGSSAEMFFKGGFPGYVFKTIADLLGESTVDVESVREQFLPYMEGLQRYMALDGMDVTALTPQAVDPTHHVDWQVQAICASLGVPVRIFLGSEAAHLASTQDAGTWNKRVAARQRRTVECDVVRPFVDRMVACGVVPPVRKAGGDYTVEWRDLNTLSDKDRADVSLKRTQAFAQWKTNGLEATFPFAEFATLIGGLTRAEAKQVKDAAARLKAAGDYLTDPMGDRQAARDAKLQVKVAKAEPKVLGGGRLGNPGKNPGRPRGVVSKS